MSGSLIPGRPGTPTPSPQPPTPFYHADYTHHDPVPLPRGSLLEYLLILRQSKGLILLYTSIGLLAGALYTLSQNPVYQARATLEIQPLNDDFLHMRDLNPTASDPPSLDPGWDLQTQVRILQTRALLNRVVARMRLEGKPPDSTPLNHPESLPSRSASDPRPPGSGYDPQLSRGGNEPRPSARGWWLPRLGFAAAKTGGGSESAIRAAADALHVRAQANTRLIEIQCDSPDPQVAADFANTLAAEFIEQNLESRWQTTRHTGEWLARQMQDVKTRLEASEDSLQSYARNAGLVFTEERDNVAEQKLKQLQDELSRAQAERIARQSRYELATQAAPDSLGEVLDDGSLKDLQAKIAELRRQLAELTSSFTAAHPRVLKAEAQIAALEASAERQRANILKRIRNDFESAQRREKLLSAGYDASLAVITAQAAKVTHYNILKREVDTNRQLYENMLQRVKEAGIAGALRASNVRVVDPAVPPDTPYKPSYSDNCALGLIGGFLAGMGFVVLRVRSDRTIHQPGDAGQYLGVRELGIVHSAHRASADLITLRGRPSVTAESLRATLASILFAGQNGAAPHVLVVSSAGPREGKTTLAANLAVTLAEIDRRVLLIDADLRRPRLHNIFEFENRAGLIDLLRSHDPLSPDAVIRPTGIPNLSLMTSGEAGDRDPMLLHSVRFSALLDAARASYDMVLIDTPPLLTMADARIIARHADGVILVARANRTLRDSLKDACDRLAEDGTPVLGAVLNDWNAKNSGRYRY
jgi:polysaccharide biosynthesis transport protein